MPVRHGAGAVRCVTSFALSSRPRDLRDSSREGDLRDTEVRGSTGHRVRLPRQGRNRELKKAIEGYWKGRVTAEALRATAAELRRSNWRQLGDAGIHEVPTGDFSYYDHVLDTTVMVGAIPERHRAAVTADPSTATSPWPVVPRRSLHWR
ncbi:hypothetical protein SHKM778_42450 [Streptomyces sp. KM77-8]|uniref:Cobalamin-independent methionine synthase MetE N-terminal domain-containing protein n=1 Tax=Streptomyces haneummycinicus TaxID=3074435 RepID=A0AAT9HJY9_9ACTN